MRRREYEVDIVVNNQRISRVVIDPHFEEKHKDSINDEIILRLVETLDGGKYEPEATVPPYNYYSNDRIFLRGKYYKLIWLLQEDEIYIGIINAYRR